MLNRSLAIKYLVPVALLSALVTLTACTDQAGESVTPLSSENFEQAMMLARNNGCMRCHDLRAPRVGPPWLDVARRYQNSPDAKQLLVDKVMRGGSGNWDDITGGAKMPAHQGRVSNEHVSKIVDFILSLKI